MKKKSEIASEQGEEQTAQFKKWDRPSPWELLNVGAFLLNEGAFSKYFSRP
jgi:hypothetical protein